MMRYLLVLTFAAALALPMVASSSASPVPAALSGKDDGTPLASARCKVPGFKVWDKIVSSLSKEATGTGPAMAVHSHVLTRASTRVWFVSAALKPNKRFHGRIATWIVTSITTDVGFLWSADRATKRISGMGYMPLKGGGIASIRDDGAPESIACAKQMFKLNPHFIWPK